MRKLTRLLFIVAAGSALAYFLTTPRGRTLLDRASRLLREQGILPGPGVAGLGADGPPPVSEDALKEKIAETRRRLQEELDKADAAGDVTPGAGGAA